MNSVEHTKRRDAWRSGSQMRGMCGLSFDRSTLSRDTTSLLLMMGAEFCLRSSDYVEGGQAVVIEDLAGKPAGVD